MAGAVPAIYRAAGRIVTIAVNAMCFHQPIAVDDLITCYATIESVGTTSISVKVEAWAKLRRTTDRVKVTKGTFVYVAIDDSGAKRALPHGD